MDIAIRALVVFVLLWLVIRVGGKREVAQLSAFDMILLVTLGDLVSQGIMQEDYSLTGTGIAVATFALAGITLSWVSFRWPRTRAALNGVPRVVVRDGEPLLEVLAGERMTFDDLCEAARSQGVRRLADVEVCVLETDGTFSFFVAEDAAGGQEGQQEGTDQSTRDRPAR